MGHARTIAIRRRDISRRHFLQRAGGAAMVVGALPWLFGYAGLAYGLTAILGGVLMIGFAWS